MLAILLFAVASASILPTQAAKRLNTTILSQEIIYFQNNYFSLEIVGEGDDSIIYMNIDKTIDAGDDIMLKLRLKHGDDPPIMPIMPEVNLCTLLWNEINVPDGIEAKYRTSQAFNIDGYLCPIQKTVVNLLPWVLKKEHSFDNNLPCGRYHYEVILEKCHPLMSCDTLIVADLEVVMVADNCYE